MCSQVPVTKGTCKYAFIFSYLVYQMLLYINFLGGRTINNWITAKKRKESSAHVTYIHAPRYQIRHTCVTKDTCAFINSYVLYRWSSGTSTNSIFSNSYSAWYKLVPAWKYELVPAWDSSCDLNFSLGIRAHTATTLHKLKTVVDAGRCAWGSR